MAKVGRPSKYRPEMAEQATKLCLLGAIDADLAAFFEVDEATIRRWREREPEFCAALKEGKQGADARVSESLYRRALGYSHEAVKIVADAKSGRNVQVPYTEHYPPDTTACIFWLKNRRPDLWRDRHDHTITPIDPADMTPDERRALLAYLERTGAA